MVFVTQEVLQALFLALADSEEGWSLSCRAGLGGVWASLDLKYHHPYTPHQGTPAFRAHPCGTLSDSLRLGQPFVHSSPFTFLLECCAGVRSYLQHPVPMTISDVTLWVK